MRRLRGADGERGSILPLVPIVVLAFFMLGGLVIDGSRELNARGEAQAYAEEAARAGATAVDLTQAELQLDTGLATQRVADFCTKIRQDNDAVTSCRLDPQHPFTTATTCDGKQADIVVNTQVTTTIGTTLLGLVGVGHLSAGGKAKARPYEGITADNAC
jgi:Flp pilus assembly protein TadG